MRRIVFSAIVAAIVCVVKAQDIIPEQCSPTRSLSLNGEWQFSVDNQQWQTVSVPHTYHISEWQKQDFICGYIYFCLQDYRTQMGEEGLYKHRIRRHGVNGTMHYALIIRNNQ